MAVLAGLDLLHVPAGLAALDAVCKEAPVQVLFAGDIVFRGFRDGVVYLGMKGACSGCPSSTATLRNGIENLLRHFLPQVKAVERI